MNRKIVLHRLWILAGFLVLGSGQVWAQKSAPAFRPAPLLSPGDIAVSTMPNGVRVITKHTPNTDLISIQVWVKAGSRHELPGEYGAANLVETAAMRATRAFPAGTDDSSGPGGAISSVGGNLSALTSRDSTFYSALVAAPFADQAFRIVSDVVTRPDLTNPSLEESRISVQGDLIRRSFDGVASAMDLAYETAFAKHPYRRSPYGQLTTINGLTPPRVLAFHRRQYTGPNLTLVVVGDLSPTVARQLAAKYFAGLPATRPAEPRPVTEAPLKRNVVSRRGRVVREGLVLAWRAPGIASPREVVALDTLLALWREGVDASLRQALLPKPGEDASSGLVSSYDVDFLTQKDGGLFAVTMADPRDKEGAVQAVLAEVKRIREKGITPEELTRARLLLRDQYIQQGESGGGQAGALGFYDMIDTYRFGVNYLSLCASVTAEDIQRVAVKYLSTEDYVRSEVIPLPPPRPANEGGGEIITASLPDGATLAKKRSLRPTFLPQPGRLAFADGGVR